MEEHSVNSVNIFTHKAFTFSLLDLTSDSNSSKVRQKEGGR
jgi:hypothetical protein